MKFSQLKAGDHFILEGEAYIKSTPLIASHIETGKQKMVAKYINVELVSATTQAKDSNKLKTAEEALDYFIACLSRAISSSTLSAAAKELVQNEIDKAKLETNGKIS